MKKTKQGRIPGYILELLAVSVIIIMFASLAIATPVGPTISYISHSTTASTAPTLVNNASHTGGVIAVMNLETDQQNPHWKAYVGNVSGSLVLQDSRNYSIYNWELSTIQGEVYATRNSSVTWTTIQCANVTQVDAEMTLMNHTSTYTPNDNISTTFLNDTLNHSAFYAGPTYISQDSCTYSTNLFRNDTRMAKGSSDWEEILLYDTTKSAFIYTSIIEDDISSFINGTTFDYQILVPEKGNPTWTGATSYYFYVELL